MFVDERIDRLGIDRNGVPLHDYLDLRERQTVFEELGAYGWNSFNLAGDEAPPERVMGAVVSANALKVVGVPPLLGRTFEPGDDAPDAPPRIVLGYALFAGFAPYLVADRGLDGFAAIATSFRLVRHRWGALLGLQVLLGLGLALAALPLGLGLIWAGPYAVVALGAAFDAAAPATLSTASKNTLSG